MDKIQVNKVSWTKALSLVVLVVFVSCTKNEPDNGGSDATQNLDEFTTYTVDINSKPISFFDLIEEVELVRLEETPESLLSWVSQLRFTDDLVIFPGNKGDVFTFKNDGPFINKFNRLWWFCRF